jgi:hypothetical protein
MCFGKIHSFRIKGVFEDCSWEGNDGSGVFKVYHGNDETSSPRSIDIDNLETGFVIRIKPSHSTSKVLVSMSCHIGMDYAENSRWWGIQLYRKIGDGDWLPVENANGSNADWLEGSPCWISHNMGADNSMYSHSIINVSGSYEDSPQTTEDVYYTAYWKSKLNNSFGRLYINRPATISGGAYTSNYPLTSSSWSLTEQLAEDWPEIERPT